jgi:uncharacterized protein involved in outer membrane biogenesis
MAVGMKLRLGATLLWLLGGLILLAPAAAWLVPPLLDWNQYRDDIARIVSDRLGRAVQIEGNVSLELLPQPILVAARISVADAGDGMAMKLGQLRLRLALGPLLSGHIDAQELELRKLDVHLPWPYAPAPFSLRSPTWLQSLSARIEDGSLQIGSVAVTGITAQLGTGENGSTALAGQATISGEAWHLTARLAQPDSQGASGLDLSLDGQGKMQGLGAMFAGQLSPDGTLAGRISGRGPDLSRLMPAPAVPFRAEGRLSLAAGLAIADQLAIEIAGSPARGSVTLRLAPMPRLDVSLAASRLDLDSWLPALLRGQAGGTVVPTTIDLSAEAATLASGTLRGLRGNFALGDGQGALRDVSAVLPGEAQLRLAGQIRRAADGHLTFTGPASLAAPDLRTSLAWLAHAGLAPLGDLPPGVLRSATLTATVTAESGAAPGVTLADLAGQIDDSQVKGQLLLHPVLNTTKRLGLTAQLELDRLALDPWVDGLTPPIATLPTRLGSADLDLRVKAHHATLRGQRLDDTTIDFAAEPGKLTLRQIEATSLGVHATGLATLFEGGRLADARLELQAGSGVAGAALTAWRPELGPLAARLPHDKLALVITGGGPPEALALRGTADMGDLHLEAQPTLNLQTHSWTSPTTLRHPGAPRLFDSIGLPGTAAWLGDGSLSLVASLSGGPTRLAADSFDLSAGSLHATGGLALDLSGPPSLTGRISADTLPLPLPYPRSPDPLPSAALLGWQANVKLEAGHVLVGLTDIADRVSTQMTLQNGKLTLAAIAGQMEGGALGGSLSLDVGQPTPALAATLSLSGATLSAPLFELPLDLVSGQLDLHAGITATGHSPLALLSTLSGTVSLSADKGTLDGVALDRISPDLDDASLRAALSGGTTAFDHITLAATLATGALTLSEGDIVTPFGTARLAGLADLTDRTGELRLAVRPNVSDPPELAVRFSGPLEHPTRTLELANALPWRAGHK